MPQLESASSIQFDSMKSGGCHSGDASGSARTTCAESKSVLASCAAIEPRSSLGRRKLGMKLV